jgi:hypothetical protein
MTTRSATDQAIEVMEEFRTRMRDIGQASPAVEKFIDEMTLLISVCDSPKTAMDALFRTLAEYRSENPAVVKATGGVA